MKRAKKKPAEQYLAASDYELDRFDWKILRALAANARATNVEIARRVGLSEAPCSRRIARLQDRGIIEGYGVRVNPGAIGIGMMAFITLTLDVVSAQSADRFADLVQFVSRQPPLSVCLARLGQLHRPQQAPNVVGAEWKLLG